MNYLSKKVTRYQWSIRRTVIGGRQSGMELSSSYPLPIYKLSRVSDSVLPECLRLHVADKQAKVDFCFIFHVSPMKFAHHETGASNYQLALTLRHNPMDWRLLL